MTGKGRAAASEEEVTNRNMRLNNLNWLQHCWYNYLHWWLFMNVRSEKSLSLESSVFCHLREKVILQRHQLKATCNRIVFLTRIYTNLALLMQSSQLLWFQDIFGLWMGSFDVFYVLIRGIVYWLWHYHHGCSSVSCKTLPAEKH